MKPAAGQQRVNATFSLSVVTAAAKQTHADAELAVPQAKNRTCVDPNIATCIWKYGDPSAKMAYRVQGRRQGCITKTQRIN